MKVVVRPIEMVAWADTKGTITPVRFKITKEDGTNSVVKIDKVICVDREKLAGKKC